MKVFLKIFEKIGSELIKCILGILDITLTQKHDEFSVYKLRSIFLKSRQNWDLILKWLMKNIQIESSFKTLNNLYNLWPLVSHRLAGIHTILLLFGKVFKYFTYILLRNFISLLGFWILMWMYVKYVNDNNCKLKLTIMLLQLIII